MLKYNREPQEIATINVGGKAFKVYKALLVKDSDYFEKALDGPFAEGLTQTIDLGDDVSSVEFGIYVDVLHRSYATKQYVFRPARRLGVSPSRNRRILSLWKLSDRFLNKHLLKIAEESFSHYMNNFTTSAWAYQCQNPLTSDEFLHFIALDLHRLHDYCVQNNLPQANEVVSAVANMPAQLLGEYYDDFKASFRAKVMKTALKRFEQPELKRPSKQEQQRQQELVKGKPK